MHECSGLVGASLRWCGFVLMACASAVGLHNTSPMVAGISFSLPLALQGTSRERPGDGRRCRRYHIQGEKKGQIENFVDNLPGYPDNIHYDGDGHYWIAISGPALFWLYILCQPHLLKSADIVLFLVAAIHNRGGMNTSVAFTYYLPPTSSLLLISILPRIFSLMGQMADLCKGSRNSSPPPGSSLLWIDILYSRGVPQTLLSFRLDVLCSSPEEQS
ncbi:hypothetical protein KSP40_PGU004826 [Platanthera guangdongensis]|uniref:Uncharacterized protein n=1 Tax=Platanthera guangdongensis TaxID=2320717 RepID=A0ABR2LMZ8_9ASPA